MLIGSSLSLTGFGTRAVHHFEWLVEKISDRNNRKVLKVDLISHKICLL